MNPAVDPCPGEYLPWSELGSKGVKVLNPGNIDFFSPEETRVISPKTLCAQFARRL